jgi:hypothetical protein
MNFEKPILAVALKKLTSHLKEEREFNEIEDISNLKKNLTFWKLKNRQFFYESKIMNEKYKTATSQNKESLVELTKLRDTLLGYCPKKNTSCQEMNESIQESYNAVSFGCFNDKEKKFKPKSILLKGSSFVEKPKIKNKIMNMSKKVSFASDFEINQNPKKKPKNKMIKMTSCFMECQDNDFKSDRLSSKQKTISIKDDDFIKEEEEQKYEIKMEKNNKEMKNSYLFVNNEKYQSSESSEDLSDLGRSFPPESLNHNNTNQLEKLRDNMLYTENEPKGTENN